MSMIHDEPHPFAGRTVKIRDGVKDPVQGEVVSGAEYRLEDWWDRLYGKSWKYAHGNFAAAHYVLRSGLQDLPIDDPADDEVVYGHIGPLGHIVHVSELDLEGETDDIS